LIIREALAQGTADLKFANIESSSLDASILLAHVLKIDRTALYAKGSEKITEKDCVLFCELIERRCGGECIAYLIGKKEFRGLEFFVSKFVLVPRPDTETLVEAALRIIRKGTGDWGLWTGEQRVENREQRNEKRESTRVLDLCTGSGAIAISLKHEMPELEIHAADISVDAIDVAKENTERLLSGKSINFYQGDLFEALSSSHLCVSAPLRDFNVIISNPPYIPSREIETLSAEVQNEPRIALDGGEDGLEIVTRIIQGAPDYLLKGGSLLMEADPRQMNEISIIMEKNGFTDIEIYNDLSGAQRVIGGRYEK